MTAARPIFFVAEIEAALPDNVTIIPHYGWAATAWGMGSWGASADIAGLGNSTGTIRVSDMGYKSLASDPDGPRAYPPYLDTAFLIDRETLIDPSATAAGASWGRIDLANQDGAWDAISLTWNADSRAVRIYWGLKGWDETRGIETDPAFSTLDLVFSGIAGSWLLTENELQIPLRDPTYYIERPYQSETYTGTGGLNGSVLAKGVSKPVARGGTTAYPIRNVTPFLVDEVNRIYQYTSGAPGTVVNLYEGGAEGIGFDSNTDNLLVGSTTPGYYRTDNARGLFQLGLPPASGLPITCDVTGQFPTAGTVTNFATIALQIMLDDMFMPAGMIDTGYFDEVASTYAYIAGIYFNAGENVSGVEAVSRALSGTGVKMASDRSGKLRLFVQRQISALEPVELWNTVALKSVKPLAMPVTLDPPTYRVRIGHTHNHTVQTSGLSVLATETQRAFVAIADRYAEWTSASVLLNFARANDLPPIPSALLQATDAQSVATRLGSLFGTRQRLYEVVMQISEGIALELGEVIKLTYPIGELRNGVPAVILREQFSPAQNSITYWVMTDPSVPGALLDSNFILDVSSLG